MDKKNIDDLLKKDGEEIKKYLNSGKMNFVLRKILTFLSNHMINLK